MRNFAILKRQYLSFKTLNFLTNCLFFNFHTYAHYVKLTNP